MQDREHGVGRDAGRDGGQVGNDRDRLQRREGEEENEVRILGIFSLYSNSKQFLIVSYFSKVHHVGAAFGGDDGGRL